jgi:hypothetical protein
MTSASTLHIELQDGLRRITDSYDHPTKRVCRSDYCRFCRVDSCKHCFREEEEEEGK